jgi:hypothetical protein
VGFFQRFPHTITSWYIAYNRYQPLSTYHLPSAPILTVPIPNLPVSVAEKALESLSRPPPFGGNERCILSSHTSCVRRPSRLHTGSNVFPVLYGRCCSQIYLRILRACTRANILDCKYLQNVVRNSLSAEWGCPSVENVACGVFTARGLSGRKFRLRIQIWSGSIFLTANTFRVDIWC